MDKSVRLFTQRKSLADMRTWQSGVLQSSLNRNTRRLTDDYLKQYGLTTMHWFIIGTILDTDDTGIRITDLAEKLGTTVGYLTNSINNLELKHMVIRTDHPTDSRTKMLSIPVEFRATCYKIEEGLRQIFRKEIYAKISRQELSIYIEVLQKLSNL